ncbi:Conserved hypothetical protein [Ramlibacter tataouinensis TTB310]|uniref:RDD domain-containing protein n=2 Tax=Ramlibacter tataouinensis TaxID=94132 RepID=F5Y0J2_RAMTT|nr:Conserved hypothetical protein [Ramlibacter tataouinensis TTB310]
MASWLYEGVLLFGVVVPAGLVFSVLTDMRHALEQRSLFVGFLFLVLGAYCSFFWWKGQTLAMKTWRIRVLDRHGRRLTPLRAAVRYVFSWIWILPPLAMFQARRFSVAEVLVLFIAWVALWALLSRFHPQRQFWHDAFAGTRLVSEPPR